jgi:quinol monooxygenase YgiN
VQSPVTPTARAVRRRNQYEVVEFRRYALHPGQRDTLVDLFDREFVETQEDLGMAVLGQFRDLDDPDSFVWMRGFASMETRKDALESFYEGPVWREHARAANATMISSDNVLLLRPLSPLEHDPSRRAGLGSTEGARGLLVVTVLPLAQATAAQVPELFRELIEPALRDAGLSVFATYATEHSENTFPGLPVREGEDFFIWMSMFEDEADHARSVSAFESSSVWRAASETLAAHLAEDEEVLRLHPTARSAVHA